MSEGININKEVVRNEGNTEVVGEGFLLTKEQAVKELEDLQNYFELLGSSQEQEAQEEAKRHLVSIKNLREYIYSLEKRPSF